MNKKKVYIIKASGDRVSFSEDKLRSSLERSGATESQIESVIGGVRAHLYDGIPTGRIYRKAFELLRNRSRSKAARYKLKKAIMELGPSGYPFERFIGAILEQQGFHAETGVIVQGRCVTHEIDVIAKKNGKTVMVECKFHNRPGVKCDVKIPLYIHSRFRDVVMQRSIEPEKDPEKTNNVQTEETNSEFSVNQGAAYSEYEGWIVTNTRFTEDAIRYGTCSGLVMLGWDYPRKGNLKERIGLAGLHPVTCLTSLNAKEKSMILENGVVLCRTLPQRSDLLATLGLSALRISRVLRECEELVYELEVPKE